MGTTTHIEWTDRTWNPTVGCSRVSPGCEHCYAERHAVRLAGHPTAKIVNTYRGLTVASNHGPRWSGEVRLVPERLSEPLSWRRPARVFVNSMSDLFHESLRDQDIAAVFGVMAACPHLTFQVLTKRADRMRRWFAWVDSRPTQPGSGGGFIHPFGVLCDAAAPYGMPFTTKSLFIARGGGQAPWPLPNVWLGVSVEDQRRADERIPHLLATPAAVRFLSCEPLIGPVDLRRYLVECCEIHGTIGRGGCFVGAGNELHWVIVGGESGPGARPLELAWARSIVEQCREADVPCFVKQLGAVPTVSETEWRADGGRLLTPRGRERVPEGHVALAMPDPKGGDPSGWPDDLRVRQFPEPRHG